MAYCRSPLPAEWRTVVRGCDERFRFWVPGGHVIGDGVPAARGGMVVPLRRGEGGTEACAEPPRGCMDVVVDGEGRVTHDGNLIVNRVAYLLLAARMTELAAQPAVDPAHPARTHPSAHFAVAPGAHFIRLPQGISAAYTLGMHKEPWVNTGLLLQKANGAPASVLCVVEVVLRAETPVPASTLARIAAPVVFAPLRAVDGAGLRPGHQLLAHIEFGRPSFFRQRELAAAPAPSLEALADEPPAPPAPEPAPAPPAPEAVEAPEAGVEAAAGVAAETTAVNAPGAAAEMPIAYY